MNGFSKNKPRLEESGKTVISHNFLELFFVFVFYLMQIKCRVMRETIAKENGGTLYIFAWLYIWTCYAKMADSTFAAILKAAGSSKYQHILGWLEKQGKRQNTIVGKENF